jgi:hypothetical protein
VSSQNELAPAAGTDCGRHPPLSLFRPEIKKQIRSSASEAAAESNFLIELGHIKIINNYLI